MKVLKMIRSLGAAIAIGIIGSLLVISWTAAVIVAVTIAVISGLIELCCKKS